MNLLMKQIIAHWTVYPVNHYSLLKQADKSPETNSSLHTLHIQVEFIYIYMANKLREIYNVQC